MDTGHPDLDRLTRMIADLETRLQTNIAMTQSIVRGTDPDSAAGREARQMLAKFQRMLDGLGSTSQED
jgi:hypothetical protein